MTDSKDNVILEAKVLPDGSIRFEFGTEIEPNLWGLMFADIVQHVVNQMEKDHGANPIKTKNEIVTMMLAELENPTHGIVMGEPDKDKKNDYREEDERDD